MQSEEKKRGNAKGRTSEVVAARVRQFRQAKQLDLAALAKRLEDIGWSIPVAALSRLENGHRRVDVDDLMALSNALGVTPTELLVDNSGSDSSPGTTLPQGLTGLEIRAWLAGDLQLSKDGRIAFWESRKEASSRSLSAFIPKLVDYAQMKRDSDDGDWDEQSIVQLMQDQHSRASADVEFAERQLAHLRNESTEAAGG